MLFLNDKEQIIKYKDEMLKINPQITEMVAKYAGCSVEEVERCVEKYFSPSSPSTLSAVICARYSNWHSNVGDGVTGGSDCSCGVNVFMLVPTDLPHLSS
ncbi:hypothetical protein ACLB2S_000356 [Escherichia coli]